jgi:hypothetical protein
LIGWAAKRIHRVKPEWVAPAVTFCRFDPSDPRESVDFIQDEPQGYLNKARRFRNGSSSFAAFGTIEGHIFEVAAEFPDALFMYEYFDHGSAWSVKKVIHGGRVVQDDECQARKWVSLDIFAPFKEEWRKGLKVKTLWAKWVDDVNDAAYFIRYELMRSNESNDERSDPNRP